MTQQRIVNTTTGEFDGSEMFGETTDLALPQPDRMTQLALGDVSGLPVHLQLLGIKAGMKPSEVANKLRMLGTYENGIMKGVEEFLRTRVGVIGATLHEHGPYIGKDNLEHEGFVNLYIKTDMTGDVEVRVGNKIEKVKQNIIIRSSSTNIIQLFTGLIFAFGAYDWPEPVQVEFGGNRSDGYTALFV